MGTNFEKREVSESIQEEKYAGATEANIEGVNDRASTETKIKIEESVVSDVPMKEDQEDTPSIIEKKDEEKEKLGKKGITETTEVKKEVSETTDQKEPLTPTEEVASTEREISKTIDQEESPLVSNQETQEKKPEEISKHETKEELSKVVEE